MVGKPHTGTAFAVLLTAAFLACLSSCISVSVAIGPRGYKRLNDSTRCHFVAFDPTKEDTRPGDPMMEITAADLLALAQKQNRLVVAQNGMSCAVNAYPVAYLQSLDDSLRRHGARLVVVTGRYDSYAELQRALGGRHVTFPVYVTSGAYYSDNNDKAHARFWKELVGKDAAKKHNREQNMENLTVLDNKGFRSVVPNFQMISWN